jgi:hypothetical protein
LLRHGAFAGFAIAKVSLVTFFRKKATEEILSHRTRFCRVLCPFLFKKEMDEKKTLRNRNPHQSSSTLAANFDDGLRP